MRPARPPLYRLSRLLRRLGLVVLVVLVVYVAAVVQSASQVRAEPSLGHGGAQFEANGTVQLSESVNLSNPGYFSFSSISVAIEVRLPNGTLVGTGGSPGLSIAGGAVTAVPLSFWLPISGAAVTLLTHDTSLPYRFWLNLTYASLFSAFIDRSQNYTWGAPLANFNATAGSPSLQPNGTVELPVTISFSNDAAFDVPGSVSVEVRSAAGASCSRTTLTIATPAHAQFDQTVPLYLSPTCNPSGGTVVVDYTGSGVNYAFPPEPIP